MEQPLILGRYRPLAELGEGGHGSVVLAFDTKMARRVAVKRLPLPRGTSAAGRAGLAEARTAALLQHPDVVTVHEWDTDPDEAFLIMEHVEGASLADLLYEQDPLDLDEAAAVSRAVGSALRYAHENGVLHLDLKPENVLVARDGRVKVTDFGVAALTGSGGVTHSGGGTLGFMPPEQLRDEEVDASADQWAMAALLYESLTGENPMVSDTVEGALFRAEIAEVPPPTRFESRLPPQMDDILLVALSATREERFAEVSELTARLAPWLGDSERGAEKLASRVSEMLAEEQPYEEGNRPGLWDLTARYSPFFRRLLAAAIAGWLCWAGVGLLGLPFQAVAGGVGLGALAAALAPGLGVAVGLLALTAGLFAVAWPAALALAIVTIPWWWLLAREGRAHALAALSTPALGAAWLGPAAPLIAGFFAPPVAAAGSSAVAALALIAASIASGGAPPFVAVDPSLIASPAATIEAASAPAATDPLGVVVIVASWAAAGAVMSAVSSRASRPAALAGGFLGATVMTAGYAAWAAMPAGGTWPDADVLRRMSASLIMVVLLAAAGPPPRPEQE